MQSNSLKSNEKTSPNCVPDLGSVTHLTRFLMISKNLNSHLKPYIDLLRAVIGLISENEQNTFFLSPSSALL